MDNLNDMEVGEEGNTVNSCESLAIIDDVTIPTFEQLEKEADEEDSIQSRDAKEYLGDSVYIYEEAGLIRMTTENGYVADNEIFLEDSVIVKLIEFLKKRGYVK